MSLATLIAAHGYWILALGCLLEGETVLVLAAIAAHRGYLNPAAVVTIAAARAFAGNEFFFWLEWPLPALGHRRLRRARRRSRAVRLPPTVTVPPWDSTIE